MLMAAQVTAQAARDADVRNFWEQAIDLFIASGQPDQALETLCRKVESEYQNWESGSRNHVLVLTTEA